VLRKIREFVRESCKWQFDLGNRWKQFRNPAQNRREHAKVKASSSWGRVRFKLRSSRIEFYNSHAPFWHENDDPAVHFLFRSGGMTSTFLSYLRLFRHAMPCRFPFLVCIRRIYVRILSRVRWYIGISRISRPIRERRLTLIWLASAGRINDASLANGNGDSCQAR